MTIKPGVVVIDNIVLPQVAEPPDSFADEIWEAREDWPPEAVAAVWKALRMIATEQIGTTIDSKFTDNLRYRIQNYLSQLMETERIVGYGIADDPWSPNTWLITISVWGFPKKKYEYKLTWK